MEFRKKVLTSNDDYYRFNLNHIKMRLLVNPISFLILVPAALYVVFPPPAGMHPLFMLFIGIPIALFFAALLTWLSIRSLKKQSKKQYDSSKMLQTEAEVTISGSGVAETSELAQAEYAWADIYKVSESGSGIYIYVSRLTALIIPKRLFSTGEDADIRAIVCANLPAAKNKLKRK